MPTKPRPVAGMVAGSPRYRKIGLADLSQEKINRSDPNLERSRRRCPVFWVDRQPDQAAERRTIQAVFCPRKVTSGWSRINKEKVQRLIAEGLMTPAGFARIDAAKQNGSWTLSDDPEAGIIPADLEQALQERPDAQRYFLQLSRSDKRTVLQWLVMAKRPGLFD